MFRGPNPAFFRALHCNGFVLLQCNKCANMLYNALAVAQHVVLRLNPPPPRADEGCAMLRSKHFHLLLLSLGLVLPASTVTAHGDFDWINKGKYRSGAGELCCGRDDCYEVAPERVLQNREGYSLPDHANQDGSPMTIPGTNAIPSEDGKYWICKVGSRMRCFFAPLNGF
jgi:hypothetical protein